MVIVRLTGGLGNQMFQYAAGRALADRLGAELLLDTRALEHALARNPYTRRNYALAPFNLRGGVASAADLHAWPTWVAETGMRLRFVRPLLHFTLSELSIEDFTIDSVVKLFCSLPSSSLLRTRAGCTWRSP